MTSKITLKEAILQNWGQFIYIGASSAFFWMGYANADCFEDIDTLRKTLAPGNIPYPKRLAQELETFDHLEELLSKANANDRQAINNKLERCYQKIESLERLSKGIPLLDRYVEEVYDRQHLKPFGKIITVEGSESGKYWSLDEWAKAHGEAYEEPRIKRISEVGCERLAQAIIVDASADYRSHLKSYRRRPTKEAKWELDRIESFFRSDHFNLLTTIDGEYLIQKLREQEMTKRRYI